MMSRILRAAGSWGAFCCVALAASASWGVHYPLPASRDDYGMKYDVALTPGADYTGFVFTLADEGRLKPVHSYTLVAYRDNADGSKSYDLQARLELKPTDDGKRTARLRIRNDLVGRTMIRVLTLSVDGRPQTGGAALYLIPLERFLPAPRATTATPAAGVVK